MGMQYLGAARNCAIHFSKSRVLPQPFLSQLSSVHDFSALQLRRRHFRAGHFIAGLFRCQTISPPAPPDFP